MVGCLPKKRLALQIEVRELVKRYGPELGDLYFQKEVSWDKVMKRVRSLENGDSKDAEEEDSVEANGAAKKLNPQSSQSDTGEQDPDNSEFSVIPNESDIVTELSNDMTFVAPTSFLEEKIEVDSKKNN